MGTQFFQNHKAIQIARRTLFPAIPGTRFAQTNTVMADFTPKSALFIQLFFL